MSCPRCQDRRWLPCTGRRPVWVPKGALVPCAHCNDNGQRPINDPDPSLADIVATLPKGHAARAEYRRLVKAAAK